MNTGKACAIFRNLTSDEYSINEKALAIHTVLQMETINGITKVELRNALKWLWNEHFEFDEQWEGYLKDGKTMDKPKREADESV